MYNMGFPGGAEVKNLPANAGDVGDVGSILGGEDSLEKEMATHCSIPAWNIPQTEEPGGLQSMGSQSRTRLDDGALRHYHPIFTTIISCLDGCSSPQRGLNHAPPLKCPAHPESQNVTSF